MTNAIKQGGTILVLLLVEIAVLLLLVQLRQLLADHPIPGDWGPLNFLYHSVLRPVLLRGIPLLR